MRKVRGWVATAGPTLLVGILLLRPSGAGAQELGTDCDLRDYGSINSTQPAPGMRVTWLGRPLLVCPDGTRLQSDSAIVYEQGRRAELIGNVRYETVDRLLESRFADYYEREARLMARGDVIFTDIDGGVEVRGETLIHLARGPQRPEEAITVTGGDPVALMPAPGERQGDPDGSPGYEVRGNRLRFEGENFFWADGDAEVERGEIQAFADSLAFDRRAGQLFLNGNARVLGEADMEGDRITLRLPGNILESVDIRGRGHLWTEELNLVADEIRITLADELIQHVVAVDRLPGPGQENADEGPRPRAVTEDFSLEGDSLEVISPEQVLQTVYAVGSARGETHGRGSAVEVPGGDVPAPDPVDPEEEALEMVPSITDSDWIEGDEIRAHFRPAPEREDEVPVEDQEGPAGEEPRAQYVLDRLEALGNARTLYRSTPAEDTEEVGGNAAEPRWAISYVIASDILIYMANGELDRLEAREQVYGIQLEPERPVGTDGSGEIDGPAAGPAPEGER
ncbi:MAG: hypothetical protein WD960_06075 [Gemmatimonadota bacterium]